MLDQLEPTQLRNELERHLMVFEPSELLPRFVRSTRDIYENRCILKCLPCTDFTIRHLAQIVLTDIEAGRRFRKVECLRVLRAIARNAPGIPHFRPETVRLLFHIYRNLILSVSKDGQWAVSVLIKGQLLTNGEIQWLIENYKRSVHPLNRLLLYPEYHPAIAAWAEEVYRAGELQDRRAEVIALVIQYDIPSYVDQSNTNLILRAVARARISGTVKETLLKKLTRREDYDILLDLALRLEMPSLIRHMIMEIDEGQAV